MSIGREDFAERKEARINRLESRAAAARSESTAAYKAEHSIMEHSPPIPCRMHLRRTAGKCTAPSSLLPDVLRSF